MWTVVAFQTGVNSDSLRVAAVRCGRRGLSVRRVPHLQPPPDTQTSEQGPPRGQLGFVDVCYLPTVLAPRDHTHLGGGVLQHPDTSNPTSVTKLLGSGVRMENQVIKLSTR